MTYQEKTAKRFVKDHGGKIITILIIMGIFFFLDYLIDNPFFNWFFG